MRLAISIAFALVVVLLATMSVAAQTSTPTPLIEFIELTPTPVYSDPDPGWSDVVWWWVLDRQGVPVGTWSDTVDVTRRASCLGSGCSEYDPGPEAGDWTYIVAIPPAQTRAMTVTCGWTAIAARSSTYAGSQYVLGENSGGTVNYLHLDGDLLPGTKTSPSVEAGLKTFRWSLGDYAAFPGVDTVPEYSLANGSTLQKYAQLRIRVSASSVIANAQGGALLRVFCSVDEVERFDGSVYVPRSPGATIGIPIHSDPFGITPIGVPTPWFATPEAPNVGITPIMTGCYTLLPSFSTDAVTKYGVPIPDISWDEVEICTVQHSFDFEWLGIDFGIVMVTMTLIGGFGIIYSRLR